MSKINLLNNATVTSQARELLKYAKVGLEIEGIYTHEAEFAGDVDSYHNGSYRWGSANQFKVERDGSLCYHGRREERFNCPAEVITRPITLDQITDTLENFSTLIGADGAEDISEFVKFNETTGAHIHISFDRSYNKFNNFSMFNKLKYEDYERFNEGVTKALIKLEEEDPSYFEIRQAWFRRYARFITNRKDWRNNDRYSAINFNNEYKTIELRSNNFRGLTKISQMQEVTNTVLLEFAKAIIYNSIEWANKTTYRRIKLEDHSEPVDQKTTIAPTGLTDISLWKERLAAYNGERYIR